MKEAGTYILAAIVVGAVTLLGLNDKLDSEAVAAILGAALVGPGGFAAGKTVGRNGG